MPSPILWNTEFKRRFSMSFYKNLKLKLGEMTFFKDFVSDRRGDLYPILEKSEDCAEAVSQNTYTVYQGSVSRLFCRFFPYATYEVTAEIRNGSAGFRFCLPAATASVLIENGTLRYTCNGRERKEALPDPSEHTVTMIVSCRPGAFDVYFKKNGKPAFFCTFEEEDFAYSHAYKAFTDGRSELLVSGDVGITEVLSYMDNGVSIADMRPIRYENGSVMVEDGRVYFTASIRMQAGCFQGVFSWIPGTAEFSLTGALFYDAGDGLWCGDVAASVLYHRAERKWLLWVCSFSHGHILAHADFQGDPRFGVNVIDVTLMEKASD